MDPDEIMIFLQTEIFYFKTFPYHKRRSLEFLEPNNLRGEANVLACTMAGRRLLWPLKFTVRFL